MTHTPPRRPGDVARLYHRLSSYAYVPGDAWPAPIDHPLVRQGFEPNHLPTFPAPTKSYPDELRTVALPERWPTPGHAATAVLAGRLPATSGASPSPLDLAGIARILYLSAGVTRVVPRRDGYRTFHFRTSRSAGGLFPLELYVAAHGVTGLPDGVHWYDPIRHALRQVGPAPRGRATCLVVTGIPWRTGWRYAERGFRHLFWDAGTTIAQTIASAQAGGIEARLWTVFPDAAVARLVGADGTAEFAIAVIGLGRGEPAIGATGEATSGSLDPASVEFPLVTLAQHAGDLDRLGDSWPPAESHALPEPVPASEALDAVIGGHRSSRELDPRASVPRETAHWLLSTAVRGSHVGQVVAVHAVEGVEPGLYRWPDLDRPIRGGNLREAFLRLCMDQALGRDAAVVVVSVADLDSLDDRGYREAQLDAGIVDGRAHLAAYALGLGASGMTFCDDELPALLGDGRAGLLLTCVGLPVRGNRVRATPGERRPLGDAHRA